MTARPKHDQELWIALGKDPERARLLLIMAADRHGGSLRSLARQIDMNPGQLHQILGKSAVRTLDMYLGLYWVFREHWSGSERVEYLTATGLRAVILILKRDMPLEVYNPTEPTSLEEKLSRFQGLG